MTAFFQSLGMSYECGLRGLSIRLPDHRIVFVAQDGPGRIARELANAEAGLFRHPSVEPLNSNSSRTRVMATADPKHFHKLYGARHPRTTFQPKDFFDYALMALACALAVYFIYGPMHVLTWVGIGLCVYMVIAFLYRHGAKPAVPNDSRKTSCAPA